MLNILIVIGVMVFGLTAFFAIAGSLEAIEFQNRKRRLATISCGHCGCIPKPDEWADEYNCIDCGITEQ